MVDILPQCILCWRREKEVFKKVRSELMVQHPGKHVLFKDAEVHGFYDSHEAAYNAGLIKFGLDEVFLVEQLVEHAPTASLTWELGLLHVER